MNIDINAKVILLAVEAILLSLIASISKAHFDTVTEDRIVWAMVGAAAGIGILIGKPLLQALQDALTSTGIKTTTTSTTEKVAEKVVEPSATVEVPTTAKSGK